MSSSMTVNTTKDTGMSDITMTDTPVAGPGAGMTSDAASSNKKGKSKETGKSLKIKIPANPRKDGASIRGEPAATVKQVSEGAIAVREPSRRRRADRRSKRLPGKPKGVQKPERYDAKRYLRRALWNQTVDAYEARLEAAKAAKRPKFVITKETCPLCSTGIRFNGEVYEHTHEVCQSPIERKKKPDENADSTMSPTSEVRQSVAGMQIASMSNESPQKQNAMIQLSDGPFGSTLMTGNTCKACNHGLDAFSGYGGAWKWVVANAKGTYCEHYNCTVRKLVLEGISCATMEEVTKAFAERDWSCYGIRH